MSEYSQCVIDFGAGHSVYEDDEQFARVQRVLAPYNNIILLLPSPDWEESLQILNERVGSLIFNNFDLNQHFLQHHANYDLAKFIIYSKGKTPEETCEEIINCVKL